MENPLSFLSAATTCAPGDFRSKLVMGAYEKIPPDFDVESLVGKEIQYGRSGNERTYKIIDTHLLNNQKMYTISSVVGCANPRCYRQDCPLVDTTVNANAVYNRIVRGIKPRTFSNGMNKLVIKCPHYEPPKKTNDAEGMNVIPMQPVQETIELVAEPVYEDE